MITALLAATAAVAQFDIKRVLAYSTISQLGYMVAAIGMGAYVAAIFHLLTPRYLQGAAVPGLWLDHPRHPRDPGYAQNGRAVEPDALDL